ncbi:NAC domain-containing protein 83 [Citrus sinensis]|uniref:NAC domain-containing protein 83 n=1 Tax=Citrus sinensis TaxID=2711 RepID=A0ACB8ME04_CITSI|nr:NAC domain-containing protein 83 [Citrus sinensis]
MMMPTGFRFNPTDEELIEFLFRKLSGQEMQLYGDFIVERGDYNVALSTNERFCFCLRENDSREVSGRGWWRATGRVKKVYANYNNQTLVGFKRPLTFHRFSRDEPHDPRTKRNKAIKTNWIMHEYGLESYTTV